MHMRPVQTTFALLSLALMVPACNLIFGIHEGTPRGSGGSGGNGGSGGGPPPCTNDEPALRWAKASASDAYIAAWAVAFAPSGDVVTAGVFGMNSFVLGDTMVPNTTGGTDIFFAKLNGSTGVPVWARAYAALGDQEISDIAVDAVSGDIVIGGRFQGALTFDGGTTVHNEVGAFDAFIARFDKDGNYKWSKAWGNDSSQTVSTLAFDKQGALFMAMIGGGEIIFDDGVRGLAGDTNTFLAKLDAGGLVTWSRYYPTGYVNDGRASIAVGPSGEVVLAGETLSAANLSTPDPYHGGVDVFVASFDGDGAHRFSRIFGAGAPMPDQDGDQRLRAVAVSPNGDIVITGSFQNALDFDGTVLVNNVSGDAGDLYLAKLSGSTGELMWAQRFYENGLEEGRSVGIDAAGAITVAGVFIDGPTSVGIDLGSCTNLPPPGPENGTDYHEDLFLARYTANGQHIFSKRIGDIYIQEGRAAVRSSGEVAVAGDFFFFLSLDNTPKGQLTDDGQEMFVAVFEP